MKKPKLLVALIALVFACLFSCEDGNEKVTKQTTVTAGATSGSYRDSSTGRIARALDGSEGDPIDLATAKKWAANYRSTSKANETLGHFFGSEIIQGILSESNCVGIRIYYAINDAGEKQLLLVGVDSTGEDLLPTLDVSLADSENTIGDASLPCPSYCSGNGL